MGNHLTWKHLYRSKMSSAFKWILISENPSTDNGSCTVAEDMGKHQGSLALEFAEGRKARKGEFYNRLVGVWTSLLVSWSTALLLVIRSKRLYFISISFNEDSKSANTLAGECDIHLLNVY